MILESTSSVLASSPSQKWMCCSTLPLWRPDFTLMPPLQQRSVMNEFRIRDSSGKVSKRFEKLMSYSFFGKNMFCFYLFYQCINLLRTYSPNHPFMENFITFFDSFWKFSLIPGSIGSRWEYDVRISSEELTPGLGRERHHLHVLNPPHVEASHVASHVLECRIHSHVWRHDSMIQWFYDWILTIAGAGHTDWQCL